MYIVILLDKDGYVAGEHSHRVMETCELAEEYASQMNAYFEELGSKKTCAVYRIASGFDHLEMAK